MESVQQSDKETIKKLRQTIREKENELSLKVSNLPFGSTSFLSGSTYNLQDDTNRLTIGGNQSGINLSDILIGRKDKDK